jgi:hypothetical protein
MLTVTPAYKTEDGKTFDTRNQALIYAAIKASGVYLDYHKDIQLAEELDKLLDAYEKDNEDRPLLPPKILYVKDEKLDMVGLRNYIQSKLDSVDDEFFVDVGVRLGYKKVLLVVLASMKENGY